MSTVVETEEALQTWDKQIDEDIAAGRLDKLWDKARTHIAAGRVKPLDEIIDDQ